MTITIDGGAGITFPDAVQQTNGMTLTGGDPRYYAARAWVNFNGAGTPAIRAAVNVSSITDNGLGRYTVNLTTAMPDANYAVVLVGTQIDASTNQTTQILGGGLFSSTQFQMLTQSSNGVALDSGTVCAVVFR